MKTVDPQHKRDERTLGGWLFTGLNLKTIVFAAVAVTATYYVQQARVTDRISVNEARIDGNARQSAAQLTELENKFNSMLESIRTLRATTITKDTYDRDEQRESEAFQDLRDRQRTTDQVLMQRGFRTDVLPQEHR